MNTDAEFDRLILFEQIRKDAEETYKINPLDADVSFSLSLDLWMRVKSSDSN